MGVRTTQAFVGLVLFAVGVWVIFALTLGWWSWALLAIGAFETWTIFNSSPNDTISEIIWALAERPILPLLAGVAIGHFTPTDALLWVGIGILCGHFFWQAHNKVNGV